MGWKGEWLWHWTIMVHRAGSLKVRVVTPTSNEEGLKTERLQIERKAFVFSLKENPRGRFLRITEDVAIPSSYRRRAWRISSASSMRWSVYRERRRARPSSLDGAECSVREGFAPRRLNQPFAGCLRTRGCFTFGASPQRLSRSYRLRTSFFMMWTITSKKSRTSQPVWSVPSCARALIS